jgi:uncharacterized glyoxalase superfamily protein PhnB
MIWDLETGACRSMLEGYTDQVRSVAITPDGKRILSASFDKSVRVWDASETEFSRQKQPDEIGGLERQSAYVVVSDADAIYARAKAAGAEIVIEIKDEDYGGRDFSCRDLEGHLWNIGTYDP